MSMALLWSTHDRNHRCYCCLRPASIFRSLIKTDKGWCCSQAHCRAPTTPIYVTCDL
jgi:hypothetical protein